MFKRKDHEFLELLKNVDTLNEDQISKHYLKEYPVKDRKTIVNRIKIELGFTTKEQLNHKLYQFILETEETKRLNLDKLIYSIIMNTLAFEANEEVKESVYKEYHDINIRKYSKPFISGQMKIFQNSYEGLFYAAEKQVQVTTKDVERIIKLVTDIALHHSGNVAELEKLMIEYKRQRIMRLKKISTIDAVSKWNTMPIYAFNVSTNTDWQINAKGVDSSILKKEKDNFDYLFID